MRRTSRLTGLSVTLLIMIGSAGGPARAHDFWIEPSNYRPSADEMIVLHLRVGSDLVGAPVSRHPSRIERFLADGPDGRRPVVGPAGGDPAGVVRIEAGGAVVVGYQSRPTSIELPAERFQAHLRHEGLDDALAWRERNGRSEAPGREMFSRCAKSIVRTGDAGAGEFDRMIGLRLELLLRMDPGSIDADGLLPVQLLHEGEPLAGALVVAVSRDAPGHRHEARTDNDGLVHLRLDRAGVWLVKSVHMRPVPPGSGADWESLWASLTFQR